MNKVAGVKIIPPDQLTGLADLGRVFSVGEQSLGPKHPGGESCDRHLPYTVPTSTHRPDQTEPLPFPSEPSLRKGSFAIFLWI